VAAISDLNLFFTFVSRLSRIVESLIDLSTPCSLSSPSALPRFRDGEDGLESASVAMREQTLS
jgi:hypothetical protein